MQALTKDIVAVFDAKQGEKTGAKIAKGFTFDYVEQSGTWLRLPDNTWVNRGASGQYITLLSSPPPPPVDPPPTPGGTFPKWGIVNADYDQVWDEGFNFVHHVSRPKRNQPSINVAKGLPATARFTLDTRVRFTRDLQFWIHGLCCERLGVSPANYNTSYKSEHASLWRQGAFMTNDSMGADYINKERLDKEDWKMQPMGCAGTLLKIVGETSKDWIFEAINPLTGYRNFHPSTHRHLFFEPNNSRREFRIFFGWDESICIPFGQYQNRAIVPIFGDGNTNRNRIQKWRVRELFSGEPVPTPYNTSGGFVYPNPYEGMTG